MNLILKRLKVIEEMDGQRLLGFRLFAPEGTPVEVVSRAGSWLNWSDRHGAYRVGSLIGETAGRTCWRRLGLRLKYVG